MNVMSQMGPFYVWKMLDRRGRMTATEVAAEHACLPPSRVTDWARDRAQVALDVLDRYGLAEEDDTGRWLRRSYTPGLDAQARRNLNKTMAKEWRERRPPMPPSPNDVSAGREDGRRT